MFVDIKTIKQEISKASSEQIDALLDYKLIIWNSTLGIKDWACIDEIKKEDNCIHIYLDDPYDIIGPICLETLCSNGKIFFEACQIITQETWNKTQKELLQESYIKQQKMHQEFKENLRRHNTKNIHTDKQHRELLELPLEGKLEVTQIKAAYKKLAKTQHPDVGGSHEKFILISEAKDTLILSIA